MFFDGSNKILQQKERVVWGGYTGYENLLLKLSFHKLNWGIVTIMVLCITISIL